QTRVRLGRHWRRGSAPRDAVRVSAAVTGVAGTDDARIIAAKFERTEPGYICELLRDDLIGGDARVNIRPGCLLRMDAREEARSRAGMIAAAIAEGVPVAVGQAGQHQHVFAE